MAAATLTHVVGWVLLWIPVIVIACFFVWAILDALIESGALLGVLLIALVIAGMFLGAHMLYG